MIYYILYNYKYNTIFRSYEVKFNISIELLSAIYIIYRHVQRHTSLNIYDFLHISVLVAFLHSMRKYSDKSNLKKKHYLLHSSKSSPVWWRIHSNSSSGSWVHCIPNQTTEADKCGCTLTFSFSCRRHPMAPCLPPVVTMGLPTLVNII